MSKKCFNDGTIAGISVATFVFLTVLVACISFKCSRGGGSTPSGMGNMGGVVMDILGGLCIGIVGAIVVGVSLALSC